MSRDIIDAVGDTNVADRQWRVYDNGFSSSHLTDRIQLDFS